MSKPGNTRSLSRHLLLGGLAPTATGLLVILAASYIKASPLDVILVTIGSVLVGVGIFDVVFRIVAFQHFVDAVSTSVLRALKLPVRAFYESRSDLESVEDELSGVQEVWAAWLVGPYTDFEAFFPKGRRGRILLTSPSSDALRELCKIRKADVETMAGVIRNISRQGREKNIEVRWFDGPVCNNLLIADPHKDRAWMRVELNVPKECPRKRPSFVVEQDGNEGLYSTFLSSFEKMWDASESAAFGPLEAEIEAIAALAH